jgi:hypothetical protein
VCREELAKTSAGCCGGNNSIGIYVSNRDGDFGVCKFGHDTRERDVPSRDRKQFHWNLSLLLPPAELLTEVGYTKCRASSIDGRAAAIPLELKSLASVDFLDFFLENFFEIFLQNIWPVQKIFVSLHCKQKGRDTR